MQNLQEQVLDDPNVMEVINRSTVQWLDKEDVLHLYRRHAIEEFPVSDQFPGPAPFLEGLFFYDEHRYSDGYEWNIVDEVRRLNCTSERLGNATWPRVGYTLATLDLSPVTSFQRRTHHARNNPQVANPVEPLPGHALVHYRVINEPPVVNQVVNQNEGENAGQVGNNDNQEVGHDGAEAEHESEDDESEDDVDGDPDYDPAQDDKVPSFNCHMMKVLEEGGRKGRDFLQSLGRRSANLNDTSREADAGRLVPKGCDLLQSLGKPNEVTHVDFERGYAFVYFEDERDCCGIDNTLCGYEKEGKVSIEWAKGERGKPRDGKGASNRRPTKTLFVINFDSMRTKERRHFDSYGKVLNVRISRNFAFAQSAN